MEDLDELVESHGSGEVYFSYSKQVLNISEYIKKRRHDIKHDRPMLILSIACIAILLYMYFFMTEEQILEMIDVLVVIALGILIVALFISIAFLMSAKKILSAVGPDDLYTTVHVAACKNGMFAFMDTSIIGVQQIYLPWNQINNISKIKPSKGFVQFLKSRRNLQHISRNMEKMALYRVKSRKSIKSESDRLKKSYWSDLGNFVDMTIPKNMEKRFISSIKKAGQGIKIT